MERVGQGTWFAIDRKIFSSDLWFASPWKLKIFIYLLGHANHDDAIFMGIPLKRGELIRSYRTIAKDCGYKVGYRLKKPAMDTVRRICEELTKDERIVQRTVHIGTLIKILNYDELQPKSEERTVQRTSEPSFNDRSIGVQDKKNKEELNKKKDKEGVSGGNGIPEWIPKDLWADFKEFRIRIKAPLTDRAVKNIVTELEKFKSEGQDPSAVINQSITRGWRGVFAVVDKNKPNYPSQHQETRKLDEQIRKAQEREKYLRGET
jgi:hypothetical protein